MVEYIEREQAISAIKRDCPELTIYTKDEAIWCVESIPAADVAPVVRGGWIPLFESEISGWNTEFAGKDPIGGYMCSVCKEEAIYDCNDEFVLSKFCPNCGAKMDEEVNTHESN